MSGLLPSFCRHPDLQYNDGVPQAKIQVRSKKRTLSSPLLGPSPERVAAGPGHPKVNSDSHRLSTNALIIIIISADREVPLSERARVDMCNKD